MPADSSFTVREIEMQMTLFLASIMVNATVFLIGTGQKQEVAVSEAADHGLGEDLINTGERPGLPSRESAAQQAEGTTLFPDILVEWMIYFIDLVSWFFADLLIWGLASLVNVLHSMWTWGSWLIGELVGGWLFVISVSPDWASLFLVVVVLATVLISINILVKAFQIIW